MLLPPLTIAEANKHLIIELHCYINKAAFWMNSKAFSSRLIDFGVQSMQHFGMYTSCASKSVTELTIADTNNTILIISFFERLVVW